MKKEFQREISCLTTRRNCNVDFIRVIACIAVVGLHTFPKDLSVATAALYYLCGFAVPFFFMSSGYFLLNRGEVSYKYAVQKCAGIIRIVFLWNAMLFILRFGKQLFLDRKITINLLGFGKEFAKSFVQRGTFWQFWYLGALLIIYMLLPFLSKLNYEKKRVLLLTCGIIAILLEIVSFQYGKPLQKYVIQTFRIWTWLFYFVLGAKMTTVKSWFSARIGKGSHFLLCVIFTVLIIVYQDYVGCKRILETNGVLHAEYFYDSLFEMIWIEMMFAFLLRINFSSRISDCVFKFASLTMGIYIIHPMILKMTLAVIGNTSIFRSISYWIATVAGSVVVTWFIKKLPFGRCLIKI